MLLKKMYTKMQIKQSYNFIKILHHKPQHSYKVQKIQKIIKDIQNTNDRTKQVLTIYIQKFVYVSIGPIVQGQIYFSFSPNQRKAFDQLLLNIQSFDFQSLTVSQYTNILSLIRLLTIKKISTQKLRCHVIKNSSKLIKKYLKDQKITFEQINKMFQKTHHIKIAIPIVFRIYFCQKMINFFTMSNQINQLILLQILHSLKNQFFPCKAQKLMLLKILTYYNNLTFKCVDNKKLLARVSHYCNLIYSHWKLISRKILNQMFIVFQKALTQLQNIKRNSYFTKTKHISCKQYQKIVVKLYSINQKNLQSYTSFKYFTLKDAQQIIKICEFISFLNFPRHKQLEFFVQIVKNNQVFFSQIDKIIQLHQKNFFNQGKYQQKFIQFIQKRTSTKKMLFIFVNLILKNQVKIVRKYFSLDFFQNKQQTKQSLLEISIILQTLRFQKLLNQNEIIYFNKIIKPQLCQLKNEYVFQQFVLKIKNQQHCLKFHKLFKDLYLPQLIDEIIKSPRNYKLFAFICNYLFRVGIIDQTQLYLQQIRQCFNIFSIQYVFSKPFQALNIFKSSETFFNQLKQSINNFGLQIVWSKILECVNIAHQFIQQNQATSQFCNIYYELVFTIANVYKKNQKHLRRETKKASENALLYVLMNQIILNSNNYRTLLMQISNFQFNLINDQLKAYIISQQIRYNLLINNFQEELFYLLQNDELLYIKLKNNRLSFYDTKTSSKILYVLLKKQQSLSSKDIISAIKFAREDYLQKIIIHKNSHKYDSYILQRLKNIQIIKMDIQYLSQIVFLYDCLSPKTFFQIIFNYFIANLKRINFVKHTCLLKLCFKYNQQNIVYEKQLLNHARSQPMNRNSEIIIARLQHLCDL